jgi:hypothetical protein
MCAANLVLAERGAGFVTRFGFDAFTRGNSFVSRRCAYLCVEWDGIRMRWRTPPEADRQAGDRLQNRYGAEQPVPGVVSGAISFQLDRRGFLPFLTKWCWCSFGPR